MSAGLATCEHPPVLQEHAQLSDVASGRRLLLARVLAGLTLVSFAIGLVFTFLDASIRPLGALKAVVRGTPRQSDRSRSLGHARDIQAIHFLSRT